MSRVQLALNVSDLDAAIDFYSKLFATPPAKVRPGYANFAIAEPPLKLVLIEGQGDPGSLNHLGVEVPSTDIVAHHLVPSVRPGPGDGDRRRGRVLLRGPGQGLGRRARRRAVGDLHRARRRRDLRRHVLRERARVGAAVLRVIDRSLARRATAEALGSAFLVAIVVGSGIFAQRLSPHDVGLQLLENSTATGAGLVALILAFGPVSGAHFNPVVTLVDRMLGGISARLRSSTSSRRSSDAARARSSPTSCSISTR